MSISNLQQSISKVKFGRVRKSSNFFANYAKFFVWVIRWLNAPLVLTEVEVIARGKTARLHLTQHGGAELEGITQIVLIKALLHVEGLLADDLHVLVQDAVLIVLFDHFLV